MKNFKNIMFALFFLSLQMLLSQNIIYVKVDGTGDGSSWANALPGDSLQYAIDRDSISQVWVAKGKYLPTGWPEVETNPDLFQSPLNEREKHFSLKNNVNVYGGFEGAEANLDERNISLNETVLSGDIGIENDSTDNCHCVVFSYENDSTASIDGFTVSGANTLDVLYDESYFSAGLLFWYSHSVVKNCLIKNNHSYGYDYGGGIVIKDSKDSGNFNNVLLISNCVIKNNSAWKGGGIAEDFYDKITYVKIENCVIINNLASHSGGGIFAGDGITMNNSLIYGNTSVLSSGSGIKLSTLTSWSGFCYITNCTFADNHILNSEWDFDFDCMYTRVVMTNTIISEDSTRVISEGSILSNCAISGYIVGGFQAENNITLSPNNAGDEFSPYFSDPDNNNYMIQAASPLRDAGILTDDVPLYDIVGNQRDSLPDIGCYEYDESSIYNGQFTIDNCELYQNYPNPFNPSTNISFYLNKNEKVKLLLYNVAGQQVKKILDDELKAGSHSILFEASDLNSGMYYYTLKTEDTKISKKMLLLK